MRSLVITALIIIFSIVFGVITTVVPYMVGDTMPTNTINETTVTTYIEGGTSITTNEQGAQDTYYNKNIDVIGLMTDLVSGTIFMGGRLHSMGMDWGLALAINSILGLLVVLDQLMYWGKIHW